MVHASEFKAKENTHGGTIVNQVQVSTCTLLCLSIILSIYIDSGTSQASRISGVPSKVMVMYLYSAFSILWYIQMHFTIQPRGEISDVSL